MDTTVKRIRPSDYELSTVQENLATSLQQVLDFINKAPGSGASSSASQLTLSPLLQAVRGPGTPQTIQAPALLVHGDSSNSGQNVVTIGDPATATAAAVPAQVGILGALNVTGATKLVGDLNIAGNIGIVSRSGNGIVIQPATTGPALYITNVAGNVALFLIYGDGTFFCQGANSANGFKTVLAAGEYWNTAPGANTFFPFGRTVVNAQNNGLGFTPFYYKWSHPGSVVGFSVNEAGPNVANKTVYIYKNGTLVYTWSAGAGGNNATFWTTQPKGAIPFAAGDTMTCSGQVASSANTQLYLHLTLEMSA